MAITNGRYRGRFVGQLVLGASKNKGTPNIEVYGEITQGDNKGGRAKWQAYFPKDNAKVSERNIEALLAAGWETEDGDLGVFADGELHGIGRNEVEFVIELESYEVEDEQTGEKSTRTTPRIQFVNSLEGNLNVQNAMSTADANSFGDKMKGLVLKVKNRKPQVGDGADFNFGANANGGAPPPKATGTEGKPRGW